MNEDDIRLLAYVDETLPAAERAQVEAAIHASPELADAVESLRASRLPYRETFAAQVIPPVPASLSANLEALLRAHAQRHTPATQDDAHAAKPVDPTRTVHLGSPERPMNSENPERSESPESLERPMSPVNPVNPVNPVSQMKLESQVSSVSPAASVRVDESRRPSAANDAPAGRRVRAGWLVAAFAAGVTVTAITLPWLPGALNRSGAGGGGLMTASVTAPPKSPQGTTWVRAAAEYQQLYVRDTIASVRVDEGDIARTVSDIRQDDKLDISVPDLRAQGLTFKGVQRLRWQDRTLVQMVYLPETGDPVALCVVRDPRPDQDVAAQQIDRMGVVTWRKGQIGYALIGAPGSVDLKAVAKGLAHGQTTPLYGLVTLPSLTRAHAAS
ncbi:putative transmembrane anti-sigma factor [Pandoraea eparura]|uniref:Putative transmembrane anti-sigma factor n=1 Tax=Pandoraea eparura TaxID=2508291 RepID=A0A5E4RVH1_9BURK|nr:anti-sigma factor [Pandoraea eparura]VVD67426.1 putative transmembrane anti-sigma factor [Pandoraea eparura]